MMIIMQTTIKNNMTMEVRLQIKYCLRHRLVVLSIFEPEKKKRMNTDLCLSSYYACTNDKYLEVFAFPNKNIVKKGSSKSLIYNVLS